MEWAPMNWLYVAGLACLCGSAMGWIAAVLHVEARNSSTKSDLATLTRRLTDSEALLEEVVGALGRMEARDKMRQVRAARSNTPSQSAQGTTEAPSEPVTATLTTAELRRQLAARALVRRN